MKHALPSSPPVLIGALCVSAIASARASLTFTPLGDFSGGIFQSRAYGVSADGSTVVGYGHSPAGPQAFRWTQATGLATLGDPPPGSTGTRAWAVSGDGSVIVGQINSNTGTESFRWNQSTGIVELGHLPSSIPNSSAFGVSDNGSVIAGYSSSFNGNEAVLWSETGNILTLGRLSANLLHSSRAVSPEGSTIVGYSEPKAFRWTSRTGMEDLGGLPGGLIDGVAFGVALNGAAVVGISYSTSGAEAFRWTTTAMAMVGLGDLPGGEFRSIAYDVTGDGQIVVGRGSSSAGAEAFLWDETNGIRSIGDVLMAGGTDLTGWQLSEAHGISADGNVIAGFGVNPQGNIEAWVAKGFIPEPAAAVFIVAAGFLMGLSRNRREPVV
ncbi:MAG: PEP-CTERM sorting domain-containing protein [Verrucomicrobiales bacterium]